MAKINPKYKKYAQTLLQRYLILINLYTSLIQGSFRRESYLAPPLFIINFLKENKENKNKEKNTIDLHNFIETKMAVTWLDKF